MTHPVDSWVVRHHRRLSVALMLALSMYHVVAILDFGIGRVDGSLYPLVDDDVMISMRFGRNLAQGAGLVYNAGERVEGFTNPLLTLLTAALHPLPIAPRILPGLLMAMNLGLSLAILWMLVRFWGDTPPGRVAGMFAGLFYVLLPHHARYAHAGYEVYMQMAILLYCLWRLGRFRMLDALVLGLLPLTHATALVMWAMLVAANLLVAHGPWRRTLILTCLAVAPFAVYELFRLSYYGESLPNTFWLKAGAGSIRGGVGYATRWLVTIAPVAVLAAYAMLHGGSFTRWLLAALIVGHLAGVVAVGGDIMPQFRFLLPCSLLLVVLAGAGASEWLRERTPMLATHRARAAEVGGLVGLIAIALAIPTYSYWQEAPAFEAQRRWNIRHIATGLALRENTRADDVVALFGLGFTGYFADRHTVDMLGKADYHIARVPPVPGRFIGHNKTDVAYVLDREPAYVEMNVSPEHFADRSWLATQQKSGYGYTFDLALAEIFRERYDLRLADRQGRRVPFAVRAGVPPMVWRVPEAFYANLEPWGE